MSEVVTEPKGPKARGDAPGRIVTSWRAIRHFYRIRPIPGVDLNTGYRAISFNDLLREFTADWRILATAAVLGLLAGILLISSAQPAYQATLSLAPAESNMSDSGGPSSASTSVLNLLGKASAGRYDEYAQFIDMTHSVRLATRLNEKYDLLKTVFPFDKKAGVFIPPQGIAPRLSRLLRSALGLEPWAPPNMVSLAEFLRGTIQIFDETDGKTLLVHYGSTPAEAGSFLALVYKETDDLLRQEKLTSHRQRLEYLGQRLADTSSLEQRNLLIGLWGREQTQMLLLTGNDPVGARMTDDIHVPNMPQNGAALTLAMGLLSGLLAGLLAIIGRSAYRRA